MTIQADLRAAWEALQTLFQETAIIGGVTVAVTSGTPIRLAEEYGAGGIHSTQAIQIFSPIEGGPVPEIGMVVEFQSRTYRIEQIRELAATYEINAVQIIA